MKQREFKVGDKVYCPSVSPEILYLDKCETETRLKVMINRIQNNYLFARFDGTGNNSMPFILHATQENYKLLSKLYPSVEFEPPPKQKEPKEIIQAMFNNGWISVDDELPKQGKNILFIVPSLDNDYDGIEMGWLCDKNEFVGTNYAFEAKYVTHWQYLPKPPKELIK